MIYQAYDLSPSQSIFDFDAIETENGVSYYSAPFSFTLNGTSNLTGYCIEVYKNSDNSLVYSTGKVTTGSIIGNGAFDKICYIKPLGTSAINLNAVLPNGENKEVSVYLPVSVTVNKINAENDPNYNNTTYSWVLIQYDENGNTTRNSNEFFVAKGQLLIGLTAYSRDVSGNISTLQLTEGSALSISGRQIYFEGLILYREGDEIKAGNKYGYVITSTRWAVYHSDDAGEYQEIYSTDWINTSALYFDYENFIASDNEYKIEVQVKYKYGQETSTFSSYYKNEEELITTPNFLRISANYEPEMVDANFSVKVCNKDNYVQIFWDVGGVPGKVLNKSGQQLAGGLVGGLFLNPSLSYNSGGGTVERKLNSIYLKNENRLVYSQEYSSNFVIPYNTHQIYVRLCNFDNSFCTTTEAKNIYIENSRGILAIFSNKDNEAQIYYRLLAVKDAEDEYGYYVLQKIDNGEITEEVHKDIRAGREYWSLIGINLAENITTQRLFNFPYYLASDGTAQKLNLTEPTEDGYNIYEPLLTPVSEEKVSYSICNPNGDKNSTIEYKTSGVPYFDRNTKFYRCPCNVKPYPSATYEVGTIYFDKDNQRFYIYETISAGAKQILNSITPLWNEELNIPYTVIQDQTASWGTWDIIPSNIEELVDLKISNNKDTSNFIFNKMEFLNGMYNYIAIADLSDGMEKNLQSSPYLSTYYDVVEGDSYLKTLWKVVEKTMKPIFQTQEVEGEIIYKNLPNSDFLTNLLTSNITAGDLKIENQPVDKWEIKRVDAQNHKYEKVGIISADIMSIRDYLVPNQWEGYYEFSPLTGQKINSPQIVRDGGENVKASWWNYSLIVLSNPNENGTRNVENIFYWSLNVITGEMHNNTTFNVQETLGKYKKVTKSNTNAISGSLECLLGYTEKGVYYNDTAQALDKLYEIQMSNKPKILKDRNGKNYLIEFTNPISYTYDNKGSINMNYQGKNSFIQPTTIKINWIQVGDTSEISALVPQKAYVLNYSADEYSNIIIKRFGQVLPNRALIYEDDLLEIEFNIELGYKLRYFSINGECVDVPNVIKVNNNLNIQLSTVVESDLIFELSNSKTYYLVAGGGDINE